jgi:hypothetical protein
VFVDGSELSYTPKGNMPYLWHNISVKRDSVRTTIDIPTPLYRKLKEQAAAKGSSVRELVLAGVQYVLLKEQRPHPKKVRFPLIKSKGPKVELTNEQIYEHVEFP